MWRAKPIAVALATLLLAHLLDRAAEGFEPGGHDGSWGGGIARAIWAVALLALARFTLRRRRRSATVAAVTVIAGFTTTFFWPVLGNFTDLVPPAAVRLLHRAEVGPHFSNELLHGAGAVILVLGLLDAARTYRARREDRELRAYAEGAEEEAAPIDEELPVPDLDPDVDPGLTGRES